MIIKEFNDLEEIHQKRFFEKRLKHYKKEIEEMGLEDTEHALQDLQSIDKESFMFIEFNNNLYYFKPQKL